ncbi:ubiquitin-conjugating enzyme E2Q-like protein 1 [Oscarella lobularis]|uniref:ubiquitin-conjugating enzyme E2Q-like protein 1 n=1 Tax=Oscarella lobularis TaxID=121494 RepID=UPI0033138D67
MKSLFKTKKRRDDETATATATTGTNVHLSNDDKRAIATATGPPNPNPLHRKRLMKEYCNLTTNPSDYFTVELVDDNLCEWNVKVSKFDRDSRISRDMNALGIPHVLLNASFPENYPFRPPFVRVVSPKIVGGFVLSGGAICMELLTPRGWSSAYTVEAVVLQFVTTVVKGKGQIASNGGKGEYRRKDAEKTFKAVVMKHELTGWHTPPKWEG